MHSTRIFDQHTKWRDVAHMIKDKPAYQNLLGQSGSTPKDFFDDIIKDEKNLLK